MQGPSNGLRISEGLSQDKRIRLAQYGSMAGN